MKKVKRFKTFEELKSCEGNKIDSPSTMKYHFDFEKLMEEIRKVKEGKIHFSHLNK